MHLLRSRSVLCVAFVLLGMSMRNELPAQVRADAARDKFQAALLAQQRGDLLAAIKLYRDLLHAQPAATPARVNLGLLLVDAQDFDAAISLYRAGLKLSPTNKDLHAGLAFALGRRGTPADIKSAIIELQPLHRHDPADDQVSMLLADAYVRDSRLADALPLLAALEQHHPQDRDIAWLAGSALIRSGQLREGLRRVDAIAAADGSADAYLLAGEARLDLQQFDQAKADAEAALRQNPDFPGGDTLLGRALEHLGDYSGAESALRRAIAADPDDFQAQFYLGALLLFRRNLPEAEQHLRQALRLDPGSAEARYKIALIEETDGERETALRDLKTVIAQRPGWMEPHSKLLALLYRSGRTEEAEKEKTALEQLKATERPLTAEQALP